MPVLFVTSGPDLESLNTEMTWRRKLVSCSVLLEFWFLGEMSSWHHRGPKALENPRENPVRKPRLPGRYWYYCS